MAIVKMEKFHIIGLKSEKDIIFETLQNFSQAEIIDEKSLLAKELEQDIYFEGKEKAEFENAEIKYAINFLDIHYKGKKPGLFESFIGNKIKVSDKDISLSQKMDSLKIISEIKKIDTRLSQIGQIIDRNNQELSQLEPYKNIDFIINSLKEIDNYNIVIGQIGINFFDNLLTSINKITKLNSIETLKNHDEKNKLFYIIYPKFLKEETINQILKTLNDNKFINADFLFKYDISPLKRFHQLKTENKNLEEEKKKLLKNVDNYMQYRLALMCRYDKNNWSIDAKENLGKSVKTNQAFIISLWTPAKTLHILKKSLESISKNIALIKATIKKEDIPPTALENPKYMQPFEAVTNIYGMPKYAEPDPTAYLAIFFIIFLALCLTDAGYGIIMIIATYLMLKFVDLPDTRLVKLLNYGGWITVIIGALTGGWFGLDLNSMAGTSLGNFLLSMRLVDPITDPITLMIIALVLGIIHIWFGLFIKFMWKLKTGDKKEAWLDDFPWVYFIASLMLFILGQVKVIPTQVGLYILYSGIAMIALTQGRSQKNIFLKIPTGIFKLYDTIGYLSDTLSYSRLLALGLATAIIGLVVNMIANLFKGVPVIGFILFILILIGGHTFNLAINLLGAFIHSARLQYVEFFTKFLEGGGRRFTPLKKNNIYTNIK